MGGDQHEKIYEQKGAYYRWPGETRGIMDVGSEEELCHLHEFESYLPTCSI